jgi:hypothetical protein
MSYDASRQTQAESERDAMLADIRAARTLDELNIVYQSIVGYRPDESEGEGRDADAMRGDLFDCVREFCYACGIPCNFFN